MTDSLLAWLPELTLSVGAMLVLLCGVLGSRRVAAAAAWLTIALAGLALWQVGLRPTGDWFFGTVTLDALSVVFRWLAWGVVGIVSLMALAAEDVEPSWTGEYLALLLFIGVGLMLMAEANHILVAYLAMELVSLGSYVLVALSRDSRGAEAGLKYLLFGALASGVMLFGLSLVYGLTRTLSLPGIREAVTTLDQTGLHALALAFALVLAGLGFKISMVPFHMWTPDAYEGAPVPVTAMLSVGPKAAGLALLLRVTQALGPVWPSMALAVTVLTVATMTLGNLVAAAQTNVKRLLAYSTIAQVGYLLIGFAVNTALGTQAIQLYLIAYLWMNLGAFACVVAVWNQTRSESLDAFRGLATRSPLLALCLTIFLLSLAGIPPFVGFIGKLYLFGSAIEAHRVGLAVAAAVNSAIALYYYVKIVRLMYLSEPAGLAQGGVAVSWPLRLAVGLCVMATALLGLFPGGLLDWVRSLGQVG